MKVALELLGYDVVYHGKDVYSNIQDADMLIDGLNAKYFGKGNPFGLAEFDKLFGHCAAVTAGPANCFGPELIDSYPDARVVLVERDFDAWFKSFDQIITGVYSRQSKFLPWILGYMDPWWMGRIQAVGTLWLRGQFEAETAEECRANARTVYEEHYREVREVTPKGRLLEYRLGDGWEPLCTFLGKEVPDVPFPRINESAMLQKQFKLAGAKAIHRSLKNVTVIGCTLTALGVGVYWIATSIAWRS